MSAQGQKISRQHDKLVVPDRPIIPFIEGDGIGPDIWRASVRVFDADQNLVPAQITRTFSRSRVYFRSPRIHGNPSSM